MLPQRRTSNTLFNTISNMQIDEAQLFEIIALAWM